MLRTSLRVAACLMTLVCLVAATPPSTAADTSQLDINKAGVEQLIDLPGIGEAIAERIVDFRKKNGPFRRVEDLLKIKGIGEKSLEKLRPHVRVGQPR